MHNYYAFRNNYTTWNFKINYLLILTNHVFPSIKLTNHMSPKFSYRHVIGSFFLFAYINQSHVSVVSYRRTIGSFYLFPKINQSHVSFHKNHVSTCSNTDRQSIDLENIFIIPVLLARA